MNLSNFLFCSSVNFGFSPRLRSSDTAGETIQALKRNSIRHISSPLLPYHLMNYRRRRHTRIPKEKYRGCNVSICPTYRRGTYPTHTHHNQPQSSPPPIHLWRYMSPLVALCLLFPVALCALFLVCSSSLLPMVKRRF